MSITMGRLSERTKVAVGRAPHGHVAYSAARDEVWVLNTGARDVSVLDGASGAPRRTVDVGASPRHLIFDDERAVAYVAVEDGLAIVDARAGRVASRVALGGGARATCLLPMLPRHRIYVLADSGEMTAVDTERGAIAGRISTGRGSSWGQPHEKTCGKLYVANAAS